MSVEDRVTVALGVAAAAGLVALWALSRPRWWTA